MSRAYEKCWYRTSFDPCSIPASFLKRLYRFDDGRLRLRWSYDRQKWAVERKAVTTVEYVKGLPEYINRYNPKTGQTYTVPNESYICARDGYLIIDYVDPRPAPGDWLIKNLQFNDIRRWGGSKEFLRKLTNFERAREEAKKKANSERWRHLASEAYDHLKRRYGEQAFVPKQYDQVA